MQYNGSEEISSICTPRVVGIASKFILYLFHLELTNLLGNGFPSSAVYAGTIQG